jgi:quinol monooxygenase YgiN
MNYAQWTSPDHARAAHSDAAVFELKHVQTSVDEPGIASGASPLTIIVVMKCTSDEQDALVRYLVGIAQEHSVHPGFLLCGIHRSLDGTRVAEYIQWRDRDALAGMSEQRSSQAHFARVKHRSTSALCEVVKTIGPYRSEGT